MLGEELHAPPELRLNSRSHPPRVAAALKRGGELPAGPRSDAHVRDAQAANIGVELDFDHPILAAPEIVVPEMLYSPPCPI